jgi:serine/threonine protein kinase
VLAGLLLTALITSGIYFFVAKYLWIKIMYPSVLLVAGYIFIVSKRFFTTEKRKELIEVSQIETNKMLGLSFQGQGMLDLAFEKFRLCPLDDNMKDTLYNLALDFERKRQYNKAVSVYGHISGKDPKFKDIKSKMEMLRKAADGAVFGGVGGHSGGDATLMVAGSTTTPTLGRYEIKKELGHGAMGVVYLGVDPKINRTVAIKTMRFEEGLEEKEMKDLKDRFFREAQAAGNLTHPNIVKIYDAGEEQDIAYIAMELLKGDDLKKWSAKENLLPVPKVLGYIASAADALEYAHKNGIVHRDIKPANIMVLEDGTIRVADFGIARITESSKTATGTVLGTPYYMSPEQIAGKKVDGRADIFSLGVTLYELLTGEKPWKGGESIGTLLFQITSDPYPDPLLVRPDLPPAIVPVIDMALKKNPDERFQTVAEMAEAIRAVIAGGTPPLRRVANPAPEQAPSTQDRPPQPTLELQPRPQPAPAPADRSGGIELTDTSAPAPATPPAPAAIPPALSAPAREAQPEAVIKPASQHGQPPVTAQFKPAAQPAKTPVQEAKPKPAADEPPMAPLTPAGPQHPAGIELAPRAGLEITLKAPQQVSPAQQPAPVPKPDQGVRPPAPEQKQQSTAAPAVKAPKPAAPADFEKTLPLIYPEEDKK